MKKLVCKREETAKDKSLRNSSDSDVGENKTQGGKDWECCGGPERKNKSFLKEGSQQTHMQLNNSPGDRGLWKAPGFQ